MTQNILQTASSTRWRRSRPPSTSRLATAWTSGSWEKMVREESSLLACSYSSFFSGDVKNLKLTVGLNHYQAATIMSSFPNNMASFPNHNISEFPFNDSIRYPSAWKQDGLIFGVGIHWCFSFILWVFFGVIQQGAFSQKATGAKAGSNIFLVPYVTLSTSRRHTQPLLAKRNKHPLSHQYYYRNITN